MPSLIFKKGLDLKREVAGQLAENYHSPLVARIKADDYRFTAGRLTVHLAREFGFCYGVDRAVDYAYQARVKFPDRQVFLTGEIIHNPHVNTRLREQGVRFLSDPGETWDHLTPEDVVILPAFGVTVDELVRLDRIGCTLVDTTCGSVLNVWKNVKRYAEDGFTSIIHGKHWHEETRATASQAVQLGGHYLVVLDRAEAELVCRFITGDTAGGPVPTRDAFLERFGYPVAVRNAPTKITGRLTWNGAPNDFDYPTLAGNFSITSEFFSIPQVSGRDGVKLLLCRPRRPRQLDRRVGIARADPHQVLAGHNVGRARGA